MKAATITRSGGPEVIEVRDYPDPVPGPDEISIKVSAAGVNFADILARRGLYPDAPKPPVVVGYEVAGTILKTGKNVSRKPGERVLALTRFHGYSEIVVVKDDQVFRVPDNLTLSQAAAIPVNYLTAWQLSEMGGLGKDDVLLVHNAGGGVGLAALDIARHRGAKTIGTASASKHDRLLDRGYDHVIDYRTESWTERVREITGGRGVDLVFDPLGGASWKSSYRVLAPSGRLGMFGVSEVTTSRLAGPLKYLSVMRRLPFYTPIQLMNGNKGVYGVNVGRLWNEKKKVRRWAEAILAGAGEGWISPHIDAAFKLEEAAEAHRYIEERKNFGKVILLPNANGE